MRRGSSHGRRRAAIVTVLTAALALASGGQPVSAAPNGAPATARTAAAAPSARPLCGTPAAGSARCHALIRDDIAPVRPNALAPLVAPSGYGPAELQDAYALEGASATNGTGRTIAIVDAYDLPTAEEDLATYREQYGLPACTSADGCFTKLDQRGGTDYPAADAGWGGEIALDIAMASAICPLCSILLVEADSASVYDLGEAVNTAVALGADVVSNSYGASETPFETGVRDAYFDHPGVVITASSGDSGYGVHLPASFPGVVAIGGTTLTADASPRGWSETAWSGAGSGCAKYEPKPSWQGDDCTTRTVVDVSAVANPNTGVAVYSDVFGGWAVLGGTSVGAPIIAAVYALAGAPAAGVYPGSHPYWRDALYDVVSGSNGNCGGSYLCTAGPGYDGPTGLGTPNGIAAFRPIPFLDIADSTFIREIVWLYDNGITSGCSSTAFCPTETVTRGQMAAFLDRALDLPPTATDFFTDDETSTFEANINRLAAAGITTGCSPTTFCPTQPVTRGQMAAFLDRALDLPPTATDFFTDDETSTFEANINRLAAAGITTGCTPTTFCPTDPVTRGQMAAFLFRALSEP